MYFLLQREMVKFVTAKDYSFSCISQRFVPSFDLVFASLKFDANISFSGVKDEKKIVNNLQGALEVFTGKYPR